jgi:hypothetical protein
LPASTYEKNNIKIVKPLSKLREEAKKTIDKESLTRNEFEEKVKEYMKSGLPIDSAEKFLKIKYSIID